MDDTTLLRAVEAARSSLNDHALVEARREAEAEFARMYGLRKTRMRRSCLTALSGGRCEWNRPGNAGCAGCAMRSLLDHPSAFARKGERKATVLVVQPYRRPDVESVARRYGLSVLEREDWSWWNPGSTTLVVFDARHEIGVR